MAVKNDLNSYREALTETVYRFVGTGKPCRTEQSQSTVIIVGAKVALCQLSQIKELSHTLLIISSEADTAARLTRLSQLFKGTAAAYCLGPSVPSMIHSTM